MRTYAYPPMLMLLSALALQACGEGENCGDKCGPSTTSTTDDTSTTTGTTAEPTTGATTGTTGTTEPNTSSLTTDEPGTSGSTGTTGSTTEEPVTGTTGTTGEPVGEPSTFGQACAPDDGPATEFKIDLAARMCDADWPEDVPIFRISIFVPTPPGVGEYPLDGGNGFAYFDDGNGVPLSGTSGKLVITEETADGVLGTYEVTLEDNTVLAGEFDSLYCPVDVLCG